MHLRPTTPVPPARLLAFQLVCASALLAACGGGGEAGATGGVVAQSIPLQTYITDNLATDYSKVWVSIETITAVDGKGAEVTLLDASASPAVVNLSSLASVGQLMATADVAPGVYTEVRVTLVNSVQLVSLDGSTTLTAKLAPTGSDVVVHVRNLALDPGTTGQLVLDFNLARFSYDATTGLVTPTVETPKPSDAFARFIHQQATVNGLVQAVDLAAGSLTVDDPHLGRGVVVTLGADAVIVDESSGATVPLSSVAQGAHVEIRGAVTPGATTADPVTVVASVVHIERPLPPAGVQTVAGAGAVSSVDGHLVTIALREASFLPGANSVVVDISSAHFAHGMASDLAPGVSVAFRGSANGAGAATVVLASEIDVVGAPSQGDLQQHPAQVFTAVNGTIATLNADGTFTVAVPKADGPVVVPGTYTVDPLHATFMEGNASCIAVGAVVQAVGSLVDTTLSARYMNVVDCAGEAHSEPPAPTTATPTPTSDSAPK
jgi:hypothetical protein